MSYKRPLYDRIDGGRIGDLSRTVGGKLFGYSKFGAVRTDRATNTILLLVIAVGVWSR